MKKRFQWIKIKLLSLIIFIFIISQFIYSQGVFVHEGSNKSNLEIDKSKKFFFELGVIFKIPISFKVFKNKYLTVEPAYYYYIYSTIFSPQSMKNSFKIKMRLNF